MPEEEQREAQLNRRRRVVRSESEGEGERGRESGRQMSALRREDGLLSTNSGRQEAAGRIGLTRTAAEYRYLRRLRKFADAACTPRGRVLRMCLCSSTTTEYVQAAAVAIHPDFRQGYSVRCVQFSVQKGNQASSINRA